MARRLPLGPAGDPARLFFSGRLEGRTAELESQLSPEPAWTPPGMPLDQSPGIRLLLAESRRHVAARRWVAATRAYEKAEALALANRPTILEAKRRRDASDAAGLRPPGRESSGGSSGGPGGAPTLEGRS
jgi:hypothetical protein